MNILKLIRPLNLLLIAFMQVALKFGLFLPFEAATTLTTSQFTLLVMATLCIAAGGNVINDIYDVAIDRINKPSKVLVGTKVSENTANRWYLILTTAGVGIGFYLANSIEKPGFAALFVIIAALLYLYASYIKAMLLAGNVLISALVAMSILIVGLFELLPAIVPENQASQWVIFKILLDFAMFAFVLNLIREIVKDLQDINGDKKGEINSLAIALGRKRATTIVFVLGVFTMCGIIYYMYVNLYSSQLVIGYFLLFIIGPLLYFCTKAWSAATEKDYTKLSWLLKVIMFFGIGSMLLYRFVPIA
ncbi:4-hydroxybenzoate polyprenyltransferase [Ulvibacter sp. MAR_2010_11]|uniref:geranylgeranylglycerol-phosphate geranylgeranyltransferase n=1 Tax=Ulvibacter sp. MAR_2010_11 TaxID=1250229 RepID=UPI000C2BF07E|nr:geranylgeranylglycerol-phosphate geranylgeranyltransferase [Ulvibacter sp. MAR_2010_11]PKA84001.1 4-hydroxybenzoate polyprenyltransferase [Ulvibacter sp. MAR_2010_11]